MKKRLATASAAAALLTLVLAGCDQNMVQGPAAMGNGGLSESLWLHPDGRETAEPCY